MSGSQKDFHDIKFNMKTSSEVQRVTLSRKETQQGQLYNIFVSKIYRIIPRGISIM